MLKIDACFIEKPFEIAPSIFRSCNHLIFVDIPEARVIEESSFEGCSSLNNITFPNIYKIKKSSFAKCDSITQLNITSVCEIGEMAFHGCKNLFNVDLKNCSVIDGYAFYECIKLSFIYLPKLIQLGPGVFASTSLFEVDLNSVLNFNKNNEYKGGQFANCSKLTRISMNIVQHFKMMIVLNLLIYLHLEK